MIESLIKQLLQQCINNIDSGNCNVTYENERKLLSILSDITDPDHYMSKVQSCDYLGVSRATFDNYVRQGLIPQGVKQEGFKEKHWNKSDLDLFLLSK